MLETTARQRAVLCAALLFCVGALAFWTRWQFIQLYGGREDSYVSWANEHYFGGLSSFYLNGAVSWARGEPYTELVYPPGYVALLGAIRQVGLTEVNHFRLFQAFLDSTAVGAIFILARAIGVRHIWALIAALTYAVLPLWAAGSTFPLAESLSTPLVLWALVVVLWSRRGGLGKAIVAGVWLGASALTRPDLAVLIAPLSIWLLVDKQVHASRLSVVVIASVFAVFIAGWGLHNRLLHGSWVFGSTSSGAGLWEGLGEVPNDYGYVLGDSATNQVLKARGLKWSSIEANRYLTRDYFRAWREHPAFVVRVIGLRIRQILFHSEQLQPLFFGRVRQFLDISGLIILGLAILFARNTTATFVLAILPVYAIATIGLIHYEPRYVRYVPVAYVLSACVVGDRLALFLRRVVPKQYPVLATILVLAGCAYTCRELYSLHVLLTSVSSFPP